MRLSEALRAWGTPDFPTVLKRELEQAAATALPLPQGLAFSSYVADEPHQVMVLAATDEGTFVRARVGVFYAGVVAGCSCADDPTPVETQREYCELQVDLDKASAAAHITLAVAPHD